VSLPVTSPRRPGILKDQTGDQEGGIPEPMEQEAPQLQVFLSLFRACDLSLSLVGESVSASPSDPVSEVRQRIADWIGTSHIGKYGPPIEKSRVRLRKIERAPKRATRVLRDEDIFLECVAERDEGGGSRDPSCVHVAFQLLAESETIPSGSFVVGARCLLPQAGGASSLSDCVEVFLHPHTPAPEAVHAICAALGMEEGEGACEMVRVGPENEYGYGSDVGSLCSLVWARGLRLAGAQELAASWGLEEGDVVVVRLRAQVVVSL